MYAYVYVYIYIWGLIYVYHHIPTSPKYDPRRAEPQRQCPTPPTRPQRFGCPPRRGAARKEQGEHGVVNGRVTKWQEYFMVILWYFMVFGDFMVFYGCFMVFYGGSMVILWYLMGSNWSNALYRNAEAWKWCQMTYSWWICWIPEDYFSWLTKNWVKMTHCNWWSGITNHVIDLYWFTHGECNMAVSRHDLWPCASKAGSFDMLRK